MRRRCCLESLLAAAWNLSAAVRLKRKASQQQGIVESFNMDTKQQADSLIGRMFFTGGVPFNLARNPYYRASYNFIANNNMGGYVPPGYNALRTTILEKEKKHTERMLEPIKSTWPLKGVTICIDGWFDPQRRPLLNFMAVTEARFKKAVSAKRAVRLRSEELKLKRALALLKRFVETVQF